MTKLYTYWQALYMSFYSRSLYLDVGRGWQGMGIRYTAIVAALCSVLLVGNWMWQINQITLIPEAQDMRAEPEGKTPSDLNSILIHLVEQVPVITIKNGEASIAQEQPYTIYEPDNTKPFAVIDTKNQGVSLHNTEAMVLLTKDTLSYRSGLNEVQSYSIVSLSQGDRVIDSQMVADWVMQGKQIIFWGLPLVVFPLLALAWFAYMMIRGLIFGVLGMVLGNVLKVEDFTYNDYLRLSLVASTPIAAIYVLSFLFPAFGNMGYVSTIIFAIGVLYLFFAVRANR